VGPKGGAGPRAEHKGRSHDARRGLEEALKRFGLRADKRFGQHFLVSERVVDAIVARAVGAKGVLEIGPGIGVLTVPLTNQARSLIAIELDKRLIEPLQSAVPGAEIVSADVLEVDLAAILKRLPEPRCIVSNMPYNITGPLLGRVAENHGLFRNAVLMMQKEVGERVLARACTPERGSLSVAMQLQFSIKKVCDAKAGAFHPPPKVDSIVLDFTPREHGPHLRRVLDVVKLGFKQPRKTLLNNIGEAHEKPRVKEVIEGLGKEPNVRPHQLTNEEWVALAERL
jgi:16S rRNA (adenine1518-N6/adenine1519-N6)-dimethyltransferase